MTRIILVATLIIICSLNACSGVNPTTPDSTLSGGIEGTVTEGPMCPGPVPIGNNPCPDQPYQTSIAIIDTNKKQIELISTDHNGYFKILLPPGIYTLHPEPGEPFPIASDQTVLVEDGQYTQVTIIYDTGIR
jgi:hypothetical protein